MVLAFLNLEALLILPELAHEVEVGGDDGAPHFDKFVSLSHGDGVIFHEVGNSNGGRSGHAGVAVHKNTAALRLGQVDELKRFFKELPQVLNAIVCSLKLLVHYVRV